MYYSKKTGYIDVEIYENQAIELTAFYRLKGKLISFKGADSFSLAKFTNCLKIIKFLDSIDWLPSAGEFEVDLDNGKSPSIEWRNEDLELIVSWSQKGEIVYSGINGSESIHGVIKEDAQIIQLGEFLSILE